jgi:hypothetical protein
MSIEDTAVTVWPDDPEAGRELRRLWLADRWDAVLSLYSREAVAASLREALH